MPTYPITGWVAQANAVAHTDRRIPSDNRYYITTFGGGADAQGVACPGLPRADGTWWYIADSQRFGCGTRVMITNPENGKRCVAITADIGPTSVLPGNPSLSVEQRAGGPIIDASPLVLRHLFGHDSYGWSDRKVVIAEVVDRSTPVGPTGPSSGANVLLAVGLVALAGGAAWWLSKNINASAVRRNPGKKRSMPTRHQIYRRVLNELAEVYGDDDWDDPELVDLMDGWVVVPETFDELDAFDARAVARELVNDHGFDPRAVLNLRHEYRSRKNPRLAQMKYEAFAGDGWSQNFRYGENHLKTNDLKEAYEFVHRFMKSHKGKVPLPYDQGSGGRVRIEKKDRYSGFTIVARWVPESDGWKLVEGKDR